MKNFILFLNFWLIAPFAYGWGDLGHQTTAQIAAVLLKDEPVVLQQIQNILGVEPLPLASTWADSVREDKRFTPMPSDSPEEKLEKFDFYHFYTVFRDPKQKNHKDALLVLKKFRTVLTSSSSREERMIALRYIIHVAGDVHQPLHVGNEFDRGGNSCKVKLRSRILNLHSVWDSAVVDDVWNEIKKDMKEPPKYGVYIPLADELIKRHRDIVDSRPSLKPEDWLSESSQLLKTDEVYPDKLDDSKRPYCQKGATDEDAKALTEEYMIRAEKLAEERLVLGGVRLAGLLKEIFANSSQTGPSEKAILKALDIRNEGF